MSNYSYIVAGCKFWSKQIYQDVLQRLPGDWHFIGTKEQLTIDNIRNINPKYIFFLHWSWLVPEDIVNNVECVCFHMTDVPYGRGGSPLQNLIIRGHRQTKLSALQMTNEFDAGPVYLKEDLSLEGSAEEIYIRASYTAADMIRKIVEEQPTPIPQEGEVVVFKRRKPSESEIPALGSLNELHDFVRMLDADGYPKAFITKNGFKFEFHRSTLRNGKIEAGVTITPTADDAIA
ncbi:methionyl-tRNA formyltransferase [bacterium SM23_57]|nr:MAG: methionyl-tRNA formyltransferase [bacterium SM23_57]